LDFFGGKYRHKDCKEEREEGRGEQIEKHPELKSRKCFDWEPKRILKSHGFKGRGSERGVSETQSRPQTKERCTPRSFLTSKGEEGP